MDNFINYAILLANKSLESSDIPVGAIVDCDGKIIGEGYNTKEKDCDILGHAEINSLKMAAKALNNWNLSNCDMYVTLKPCSMCFEIIRQCRIKNVYYLLEKPSNKKEFSKTNFLQINNLTNEKIYSSILSNFFKKLREKK